MANYAIENFRARVFQTFKDFQSGKITLKEVNIIVKQRDGELKAIEKQMLEQFTKQLKSGKMVKTSFGVINPITLTSADIELAKMIKEKLRKTAETIVEIGEDITKAVDKKPKGYKDLFYQAIGMSSRSAQRYMQIANHVKIQELKMKQQLEGKTMTDLLLITSPEPPSTMSINASKVANGIYARYKDSPNELENIIKELQKLIDDSAQVVPS